MPDTCLYERNIMIWSDIQISEVFTPGHSVGLKEMKHHGKRPGPSAGPGSFTPDHPLSCRGAAGLQGWVLLLFLTAPCIDLCTDRSRPCHAPPAIRPSNTNNYTTITSPAAPAERGGDRLRLWRDAELPGRCAQSYTVCKPHILCTHRFSIVVCYYTLSEYRFWGSCLTTCLKIIELWVCPISLFFLFN